MLTDSLMHGSLMPLYLEYQHDENMRDSDEMQRFTSWTHSELAPQRQGPRGGKKPLRPRQQLLQKLEAELEQKLQELTTAEAERGRLQQRAKVLETVLPIRERQVQLLKQRRQAAHVQPLGGVHPVHTVCFTELRPSTSRGGLSSSGSSTGLSSDDTVDLRSGTGAAAAGCQRPAALSNVLSGGMDDAQVDRFADQLAPFTSLPAHTRVPCHVLRHLSSLWKEWVRDAGLVLHAYDARPHDPGPQLKLAQLYEQLAPTFHSLRLEHPSLLTELAHLNTETGQLMEPPPDSYWTPVAQGLRLTPEQAADAKAALALYNERAAKALEERRRLAARLGSLFATLQGMAPHGRAAGAGIVGQLALQIDEVAGQLYRNVMEQGSALEMVKDFMATNLFSLVQIARFCVLSYPYFPDVIAVFSSLDFPPSCPAGQG